MDDGTEPAVIPARAPYGQSTDYSALHHKVRRHRGSASLQQCVRCDGPAKHWARLHEADGTDIWADYVPMCVKCHMGYDLGGRPQTAEHRAKLAERARNRSPEHIAKISAALKGRPGASPGMTGKTHSESTRQKLREATLRQWAKKRGEVTEPDGGERGCLLPGDAEDRQEPPACG